MKKFALTAGLALLSVGLARARDDKKDLDKLQGTREVVPVTVDGKEMPAEGDKDFKGGKGLRVYAWKRAK